MQPKRRCGAVVSTTAAKARLVLPTSRAASDKTYKTYEDREPLHVRLRRRGEGYVERGQGGGIPTQLCRKRRGGRVEVGFGSSGKTVFRLRPVNLLTEPSSFAICQHRCRGTVSSLHLPHQARIHCVSDARFCTNDVCGSRGGGAPELGSTPQQ